MQREIPDEGVKMATGQHKAHLDPLRFHESKSIAIDQRRFRLEYRNCCSLSVSFKRCPETKRSSMEWRTKNENSILKAKGQLSAGRVLTTVFWDSQCIVQVDFLQGLLNFMENCRSWLKYLLGPKDIPFRFPPSEPMDWQSCSCEEAMDWEPTDNVEEMEWEEVPLPPQVSAPSPLKPEQGHKENVPKPKASSDRRVKKALRRL
ncbi:hypothetical protein AVEN_246948-1 [Araneus ventricosus]|uniref:Uncharacterized protein n=1 Tax=Araneus ventricosus TaxID=182803 RepID=A0A4Y2MBL5_ARAVE|nr:hypothetical protein AVEN_246948-1 [Araneus ventricosus]